MRTSLLHMRRSSRQLSLALLLIAVASACSPPTSEAEREAPGELAAVSSALTLSLERQTDDPLELTRMPGGAHSATVVAGGSSSLVAWKTEQRVYVSRVAPSGAVLDRAIRVGDSNQNGDDLGNDLALAFDGTNYLVVWGHAGHLRMARITQNGAVLDPGGMRVSARPGTQSTPAVAFDGQNYLITWMHSHLDDATGWVADLYGARVTPGGLVLDPEAIPVSVAPGEESAPQLTFDGQNFWAVWWGLSGVRGVRISSAGQVLDPTSLVVANGVAPKLAFDGSNVLVAWASGNEVRGRFLARSDQPLGEAFLIGLGQGQPSFPAPTVVTDLTFDGTHYLATWQFHFMVRATRSVRVSPSGAAVPPVVSLFAQPQGAPRVAFDGSNYLAVTAVDTWSHDGDIVGTRLSPAATVVEPTSFMISRGINQQRAPVLTSNANGALLVWSDVRDPEAQQWGIYAARLDAQQRLLTPVIHVADTGTDPVSAAVASNGTDYLVTWAADGVHAARVSASGAVLDPAAILVDSSPGARKPRVAYAKGTYLVAWDKYTLSDDVYRARIDANGVLLDPSPIAAPPSILGNVGAELVAIDAGGPTSSPNDPAFLLAWSQLGNHPEQRVVAARLSANGSLLGNVLTVSAEAAYATPASLAFDGAQVLLAWQQQPNPQQQPQFDLYAARIQRSGAVLDPGGFRLAGSAANETSASVSYNGLLFAAAWTASSTETQSGDARGAWIDAAGHVLRNDVPLSPPNTEPNNTYLARTGSGKLLLAYDRFVPERAANRVFYRELTCSNAADCAQDPVPACQWRSGTSESGSALPFLIAASVLLGRYTYGRKRRSSCSPAL